MARIFRRIWTLSKSVFQIKIVDLLKINKMEIPLELKDIEANQTKKRTNELIFTSIVNFVHQIVIEIKGEIRQMGHFD